MAEVTRFRPEDIPARKLRSIFYTSIKSIFKRREKRYHPKDKGLRHETGFQDLPTEVRLMIWGYATQRIHDIHPALKHQRPKKYLLTHRHMAGRLTLQTNNRKLPATMSICTESREVALKMLFTFSFHLHPDTKSYRIDHTCVKVKPFVFSPSCDILYIGGLTASWLSEKWARPTPAVDNHWLPGMFKGWEHVGFDFRAAVWLGVHQYRTDSMQRTTRHHFRDIFPSLKHASTVIDTSDFIVKHEMKLREKRVIPDYEGTSFIKTTDDEMREFSLERDCFFFNTTLHWQAFFDQEYGEAARPTIEAKRAVRTGKELKWL